ncbi:MAG: peptide deformylase [Bacilli bacterium]|nr:peptide deformylase [Bacilli bacterium]MBR6137708.1 peptide deformylase [Bacilli bacterium]
MLLTSDILDEKDPILRTVSEEVTFPLTKEDKETMNTMIEYLRNSQIPKISEEYNLRPGWGMSAIQLGVPKRYFVVVSELTGPDDEKKEFETYVMINPRIISNSVEQIYVDEGEGCLSVNRPVEGIVPRYARVTMEAYDMEGRKIHVRAREDLAICFQHELDHLNGILFVDHIDPKNPYKGKDQMRGI